jgi:hypothetical protein
MEFRWLALSDSKKRTWESFVEIPDDDRVLSLDAHVLNRATLEDGTKVLVLDGPTIAEVNGPNGVTVNGRHIAPTYALRVIAHFGPVALTLAASCTELSEAQALAEKLYRLVNESDLRRALTLA